MVYRAKKFIKETILFNYGDTQMKSLFKKNKTGQLGSLQNMVISLVVIGFVLVIGLTLMTKVQDEQTINSTAYNASSATIDAMAEIPDWFGIIVIAVIAVVILGIIALVRRAGTQ